MAKRQQRKVRKPRVQVTVINPVTRAHSGRKYDRKVAKKEFRQALDF